MHAQFTHQQILAISALVNLVISPSFKKFWMKLEVEDMSLKSRVMLATPTDIELEVVAPAIL